MRWMPAAAAFAAVAYTGAPAWATRTAAATPALPYAIVGTGQERVYGAQLALTAAPAPGQPAFGQDAQRPGPAQRLRRSADGLTVTDASTGLMWPRGADTNGDGAVNSADKLDWAHAQARPGILNAARFAGHSDWRLPTIKELYSLIQFSGTDPSGPSTAGSAPLTPFIDTRYFRFAYGEASAGDRIIDAQYASATVYTGRDRPGSVKVFGVNFADGRIKGYGTLGPDGRQKGFYVLCVRGNPRYGRNAFQDNRNGTVTDRATGLMWMKSDSGAGMDWLNALAWAQAANRRRLHGHSDWRVPDAKELQSIVDYTRAPDVTGSPAIDPVFESTPIVNEAGVRDWPYVWTSTTHASSNGRGAAAAYVAFGRGLGCMFGTWVDVHGAGCQRSDPKTGDPALFPTGRGPQGDAIRIRNFVRLVRTVVARPQAAVRLKLAPVKVAADPQPQDAAGSAPIASAASPPALAVVGDRVFVWIDGRLQAYSARTLDPMPARP